jgi:hypothetical protein
MRGRSVNADLKRPTARVMSPRTAPWVAVGSVADVHFALPKGWHPAGIDPARGYRVRRWSDCLLIESHRCDDGFDPWPYGARASKNSGASASQQRAGAQGAWQFHSRLHQSETGVHWSSVGQFASRQPTARALQEHWNKTAFTLSLNSFHPREMPTPRCWQTPGQSPWPYSACLMAPLRRWCR